MAAVAPPSARATASARVLTIGFFIVFVLVPLYWVVDHLDQAEQRLSDDAAGLVPGATHNRSLHRGAFLLSRASRGSSTASIVASASTVLSTVMGTMMAYSLARFNTGGDHLALWVHLPALPAAGRHHPADLPPVSEPGASTIRASA